MEIQAQQVLKRIQRLQGRQCQRHVTKHVSALVRYEQAVSGFGCQVLPSVNSHLRQQNNNSQSSLVHHLHQSHHGLNNQAVNPYSPQSSPTTAGGTSGPGSGAVGNNADLTLAKLLTRPTPVRPPIVPSSPYSPYSGSSQDRTGGSSKSSQHDFHLDPNEVEIIDSSLGILKENIHHLETDYDSDATESSSGGDSCDEEFQPPSVKFSSSHFLINNPNGYHPQSQCWISTSGADIADYPLPHHTPGGWRSPVLTSSPRHKNVASPFSESTHNIRESISWKWAVERGAVASRWMWLFAQVADLEFKIRQQNEMYRNLRLSKGPIVLEARADSNPLPPLPALTPGVPSSVPPAAGSASGHTDHSSSSFTPQVNVDDSTHQSVRTMPVKNLRKRRLIRSTVPLTISSSASPSTTSSNSRKMARYSSVQCSCSSLPRVVGACLICSGRYTYVQVIDTDCMPIAERIALLDSSCHPVLTLGNQISLGLHFCKFLKKETVQKSSSNYSPSKSSSSALQLKRKKLSSAFEEENQRNPYYNHNNNNRAKFNNKSNSGAGVGRNKSQSVISSNKLKKKYNINDGTGSSARRKYSNNNSFDYHHSNGKRPRHSISKRDRERHESSSNGSADSSYNSSPHTLESAAKIGGKSAPRRRRSESQHAFDIDNIVIPYSIASTTRVEKLQYKEILTPKWRIIEYSPLLNNHNNNNSLNDNSDDHLRDSESTEKQNNLNKDSEPAPMVTIKSEVMEVVDHVNHDSGLMNDEDLMAVAADCDDSSIVDGVLEDLSDLAFAERHMKCEIEEKKRFHFHKLVQNQNNNQTSSSPAVASCVPVSLHPDPNQNNHEDHPEPPDLEENQQNDKTPNHHHHNDHNHHESPPLSSTQASSSSPATVTTQQE